MKTNPWILALAAMAVSLVSTAFSWTSRPKIGYAETTVLITGFTEAVKAKKQFEESQKKWDADLARLNDSLVATVDLMKGTYESAAPAEKQRLRALLEKRNDDLQRYTAAVRKMSEDREGELMRPVIQKMNGFLESWGGENGYDLILGTTTGGNILQARPELNVTERVLKAMNKHFEETPEAMPKEAPASAPRSLKPSTDAR